MLLTIVGSLALASGVFVAVITMTRTPANHRGIGLPLHGAVYVGADTCFTCHEDQDPDWSEMSYSVPATSPVTNLQTGLVEVSARAQIPHVGGVAASSVDVIGGASDVVSRHYVIATEADYDRLPSQAHPAVPSSSEDAAHCLDCHTDAQAAGDVQLQYPEGACAICHPVVSRVSRTALTRSAQYG